MARKQKAQSCALGKCGRKVAIDNPTFPYCHYHQHLKTAQSRMTSPESGMSMDEQRELLYAPKSVNLPRGAVTVDVMVGGVGSKLSSSVVIPSFSAWNRSTRGIDMSDPEVSRENRDRIIDDVRTALEKRGKVTTTTLSCHGGFTLGKDGESLSLDDHRVILVNDTATGDNIVIDVATTAPMIRHRDELDAIESGNSTLKDNFFVAHMYEFAEYSSAEYKSIVNEETGDTVWENNVDLSDTPEARDAREALKKYGHPNPVGTKRRQPEPEPQPTPHPRQSDEDLTLDEMISGFYDNDGNR